MDDTADSYHGSEDEETPEQEFVHEIIIEEKFSFITEIYDNEDGYKHIEGKIMHQSKEVGTLTGYLINRNFRSNFFEVCDSISGEMQLLSNVLFLPSGRLNKFIWSNDISKEQIMQYSHGGFLCINVIRVEKYLRGRDLAFKLLQKLFKDLEGQWSISVIVPGVLTYDSTSDKEEMKVKEDRVCQLFARCGYKFLSIESNESYWYLVGGCVKSLEKEEVSSVRSMFISNDNWSEYQNKIAENHSTNCMYEALFLGLQEHRKKPAVISKAITEYQECIDLMPSEIKNIMIKGIISPCMFSQLEYAATISSDLVGSWLESTNFPLRTLIPEDTCRTWVPLFNYLPPVLTEGGVYKSFIAGFAAVLNQISILMGPNLKCIPTVNLVTEGLKSTWPPYYRHFFKCGGKIEYLIRGIIASAKENSWAYGDGSYDEVMAMGDEEEILPQIKYFDNDFFYVETVVLKYILEN